MYFLLIFCLFFKCFHVFLLYFIIRDVILLFFFANVGICFVHFPFLYCFSCLIAVGGERGEKCCCSLLVSFFCVCLFMLASLLQSVLCLNVFLSSVFVCVCAFFSVCCICTCMCLCCNCRCVFVYVY